MEPSSQTVDVTRPAAEASGLARMDAHRLGHHYLGPEHMLLGLLLQGDNPAARVLAAHGLDLAAARVEADRLIAQGVLPRPQPSDTELLATLGVDLEAVHARVQETFGEEAYFETVQRVQHRSTQAVAHAPLVDTDPSPLVCVRAWRFAYDEAVARDQEIGPEHLLLGMLAEAINPVDTDLPARERRQRTLLGLPDHGPHPIRLLVEARGTTLDRLRTAVLEELDREH